MIVKHITMLIIDKEILVDNHNKYKNFRIKKEVYLFQILDKLFCMLEKKLSYLSIVLRIKTILLNKCKSEKASIK